MARGRRLRFRTGNGGEETLHIDGRGAGSPQAEFTEYLDEGQCLAARADGDEVSDLAGRLLVAQASRAGLRLLTADQILLGLDRDFIIDAGQ